MGFRRFLRLVESQQELLPSWWSTTKADECVALGLSGALWNFLALAVQEHDIIQHYRSSLMPMQLRIGEQISGTGPTGMPGTTISEAQMMIEKCEGPDFMANLDTSVCAASEHARM